MLMSDEEILKAVESNDLRITDFDRAHLQGASYDCRVGREVQLSRCDVVVDMEQESSVKIEPGEFALVATLERFQLPQDIVRNVGPRTYLTRKGLTLLAGIQVDPGFKGILGLAVYNASPKSFLLEYKQDICTLQFFRLSSPAKKSWTPTREQLELQEGRLPRADREYFRELEAESLTVLGRDLRHLTQTVGGLSEEVRRIGHTLELETRAIRESVAQMSRLFFYVVVPMMLVMVGTVAATVITLLKK